MLDEYLPSKVNTGPWITAYTLNRIREAGSAQFVLPICSLATPYSHCVESGDVTLPPLFHEALTTELQQAIVTQIFRCFPYFDSELSDSNRARLRVVEIPRQPLPKMERKKILAFSVDTAVEEHGPHLPLATDTIQSYGVLRQLADEYPDIELVRPVEYGQLTWGLPFGHSIDLTADLLTQYVRGYVDALVRWRQPDAIYVVDVHGSIVHREAIVKGLETSCFSNWSFRWLHEPLAEFASQRGDQHAGGVETALVEQINPALLDAEWWPHRIGDIEKGQLSFDRAVELSTDLDAFVRDVKSQQLNGVVGDIRNYEQLDADELFGRMLTTARDDIECLLSGEARQAAGKRLW